VAAATACGARHDANLERRTGHPFAIVEREREGVDSILMIVDEEAEAETLVVWLRFKHVRGHVRTTEPEPRPTRSPMR
jgi:hypothetical protein